MRQMPRLDGSAVMGRGFLSWFSDARIEEAVRLLSGAQGSTDGGTNKCATHYRRYTLPTLKLDRSHSAQTAAGRHVRLAVHSMVHVGKTR